MPPRLIQIVTAVVIVMFNATVLVIQAPWRSPDRHAWALVIGLALGSLIAWGRLTAAPAPRKNAPSSPANPRAQGAGLIDLALVLAPTGHILLAASVAAWALRPWPMAAGLLMASPLLWSPLLMARVDTVLGSLGIAGCMRTPQNRPLFFFRRCLRLHTLLAASLLRLFHVLPWFNRLLMVVLLVGATLPVVGIAGTAIILGWHGYAAVVWSLPLLLFLVATPAGVLALNLLATPGDPGLEAAQETGQRWQEAAHALAAAAALEQELPLAQPHRRPRF